MILAILFKLTIFGFVLSFVLALLSMGGLNLKYWPFIGAGTSFCLFLFTGFATQNQLLPARDPIYQAGTCLKYQPRRFLDAPSFFKVDSYTDKNYSVNVTVFGPLDNEVKVTRDDFDDTSYRSKVVDCSEAIDSSKKLAMSAKSPF